MKDALRIRRAKMSDAAELAALAKRTFLDAFAADNEPSNIEAYVDEAFTEKQVQAELDDDRNGFFLVFGDGDATPIGYGKLRAGPADPAVTGPDPIEIERIYVDRRAIGRGVGAALMKALLDEAIAAGHQTVWLGVWEHNPRAIRFYEKWGFETVGEHVFRLGEDDQTDLIMQRPAG